MGLSARYSFNMADSYSKPKIPSTEAERLKALQDFEILDTPPDSTLDDLTQIAAQICGAPMAMVSLIDKNRQWFKSRVGLDTTETSRDVSFCGHAILETEPLVVEDATQDPKFKNNPLVTGNPLIRFYAGAQLNTTSGHAIGTLCVLDTKPRQLNSSQVRALQVLSRQVVAHFERQRAERQLGEQQNLMQNIMGVLPSLASVIDKRFTYQYVNPAYEKWFSVNLKDVLGKHMSEVVGAAAFEKGRPFMDRALAGESVDFATVLPYVVNGTPRPTHVKIFYRPKIAVSGEIVGFYALVMDVTDLHLALTNLELQEKAFRNIFQNSPVGIIQLDMNLRYVYANQAYCSFLGLKPEDIVGKSILDFTHPDDIDRSRNKACETPKLTGSFNRFEKRYLAKDGRTVWGLVSSRRVTFEESGEEYFFSIVEDITEIREREIQLKVTQAQLIESSKMASLGEMAGGIAHEINNPLAIIQAKAGQMKTRIQEGAPKDSQRSISDLEKIEQTVDRIAKIIKGLRSFSRNSEQDPMEETAVSVLLEESLELCRERLRHSNILLRIKLEEGLKVECRAPQISQILLNLVNNAHDAVQGLTEKWVQIEGVRSKGRVILSVTDSGRGIPEAVVDKMMQPFFTTKEIGKGTGLGLSISLGLAMDHGGTLKYDYSSSNTKFILDLPATQNLNRSRPAKKTA